MLGTRIGFEIVESHDELDGVLGGGLLAAEFVNFIAIAKRLKGSQGSFDHISMVVRAEGFGQDIFDPCRFQYGTDAATSNDAGSR